MDRSKNAALEDYISLGRRKGLWRRGTGFRHYCRYQLFPSLNLRGKRILEIGAGDGRYSLWAAVQGAREVVALEPTLAGSDESSSVATFRSLVDSLKQRNVSICEQTFQQYAGSPGSCDLILSHYSINHLHEQHCISLRTDPQAREYYVGLFRRMYTLLARGGTIIIVDCSDRSAYSDIGVRHPLSPTIEWFKHHPPDVWITLLTDAGFTSPRLTWIYDNRLLHVGRLFRNKAAAYFYTSMFRIEMRKDH